jgi:hypothetical protein
MPMIQMIHSRTVPERVVGIFTETEKTMTGTAPEAGAASPEGCDKCEIV